ncbi:uncharacterized protein LOC127854944 [Dreissena polymorpha]|nr:uncharacterized protein LOC127854944 [Dreissena polymorpha]
MRNIILCSDVYLANPAGVFCYACVTNGEMDGDSKLNIVKLSIIGLCIKFGDLDTLSALMNNGSFREQIIQRGLREAIDENSTDGVELLFKNGARPDLDTMKIASTKSVSVFEAVFRKFRKDFKIYALQHPEHIVRELVMPAILTRNTGIVKVLIQNGAPVHCKGFYTPLAMAVLENQPEVTQILLESHVDRNMELQGCNLLDIAICMGYTEVTDVLRKFGFKRKNKSPKDIVPCSLLIGIASKLDLVTDVMKLRRQIEMKHHAHNDDTVLHVALKTRLSRALIGELLKMGSDVNAKNKKQETPLMCAVSKESGVETDVIREILYYNPVLEQCDKSGKTTLALAIANDQSEKEKNRREEQTTKSKGSCANVNVNESIAPLLLDCGYNVKYDYVKKPHHTVYALRAVWKDLAATIGCGRYGLAIQDNPKLLQIRCREILRRSNPGIHLHRFLERMKVPSDISDFVLMTSVLKGQ